MTDIKIVIDAGVLESSRRSLLSAVMQLIHAYKGMQTSIYYCGMPIRGLYDIIGETNYKRIVQHIQEWDLVKIH